MRQQQHIQHYHWNAAAVQMFIVGIRWQRRRVVGIDQPPLPLPSFLPLPSPGPLASATPTTVLDVKLNL